MKALVVTLLILGAIVSAITGQAAEAFMTQRILEPLGMNDTFALVSAAGDKLNRFTPAYRGVFGIWVPFWSLLGGTASAQARVELKKAEASQLWPDSRLSSGEDRNAVEAQQGSAHDHLASRLDKNTN